MEPCSLLVTLLWTVAICSLVLISHRLGGARKLPLCCARALFALQTPLPGVDVCATSSRHLRGGQGGESQHFPAIVWVSPANLTAPAGRWQRSSQQTAGSHLGSSSPGDESALAARVGGAKLVKNLIRESIWGRQQHPQLWFAPVLLSQIAPDTEGRAPRDTFLSAASPLAVRSGRFAPLQPQAGCGRLLWCGVVLGWAGGKQECV